MTIIQAILFLISTTILDITKIVELTHKKVLLLCFGIFYIVNILKHFVPTYIFLSLFASMKYRKKIILNKSCIYVNNTLESKRGQGGVGS